MDIPLIAGTVATVVFAISNLPMLTKALRTRDVSSYSLVSLGMINAANAVYSLYVFTLPVGPIWALHTFYVVSCAVMLVLCVAQRRAAARSEASQGVPAITVTDALERVTLVPAGDRSPDAPAWSGAPRRDPAAR